MPRHETFATAAEIAQRFSAEAVLDQVADGHRLAPAARLGNTPDALEQYRVELDLEGFAHRDRPGSRLT